MTCGRPRPSRAAGFLNVRGGKGLWCWLLAAVLLGGWAVGPRSEPTPEIRTCRLPELLDHLRSCGVDLRVIPGDGAGSHVYLTENPGATWEAMQHKAMVPEYAHGWQGTVWVGYVIPGLGVEESLAAWGENGCRVGHFLIFGDERLVRRIHEACQTRGGR